MEHTIISRLDLDTVSRRYKISSQIEDLKEKHKTLMLLEIALSAYIEDQFGELSKHMLNGRISLPILPQLRNIVSSIEMEYNIILDSDFYQNKIFNIDGKRCLRDFVNDLIDHIFENHI